MKQKKEPRHGWATACGAKARKAVGNYSPVAASRQELIDRGWWPAGVFLPVQLDFRLVEPLAWLVAALLLGGHHA